MNASSPDHCKKSHAFTLIELLVVVAIIVILITILLPALAYVRVRAQVTSTTTQLQSVREACEGYIATFQHYPGVFSDADVSASHLSGTSISGTQNMLLSLMGSINPIGTANATTYTINNHLGQPTSAYIIPPMYTTSTGAGYTGTIASGPIDQGNGGKQYPGFYAPKLADITTKITGIAGTNYSSGATALPTLVDHFADPLPILYYRKTPGIDSPAVAAQWNTPTYPNYSSSSTPQSTGAAYYRNCNAEYTDTTALAGPTGAIFNQNGATTAPMYGGASPTTTVYPNAALASMTLTGCQIYSNTLQYALGAIVANETSGVGTLYQCNSTAGTTGNAPPAPPAANTSYWMNMPTPGGAFILIAAGPIRMYGASDSIVVVGGQ